MKDGDGNFASLNVMQKELKMLFWIHSLLFQPENLCFTRVFKTGRISPKSTILVDQLLPLLRKNSLIKFSYSPESEDCFPTPLQMQFLWGSQKLLQNLKLYSDMFPGWKNS